MGLDDVRSRPSKAVADCAPHHPDRESQVLAENSLMGRVSVDRNHLNLRARPSEALGVRRYKGPKGGLTRVRIEVADDKDPQRQCLSLVTSGRR